MSNNSDTDSDQLVRMQKLVFLSSRAHVKDPVVHVTVRWILETLKEVSTH